MTVKRAAPFPEMHGAGGEITLKLRMVYKIE